MRKDSMSKTISPRWSKLNNLRMAEKLTAGECINLASCKRNEDGDYILEDFVDGVDYCNSVTEQWIWSIGENRNTGEILASHSTKFYDNPIFKCLWLR